MKNKDEKICSIPKDLGELILATTTRTASRLGRADRTGYLPPAREGRKG